MSRRGIHPLLMGLDRPERVVAHKHPVHTSGLESAQRKRYLRLEAEEAETATQYDDGDNEDEMRRDAMR